MTMQIGMESENTSGQRPIDHGKRVRVLVKNRARFGGDYGPGWMEGYLVALPEEKGMLATVRFAEGSGMFPMEDLQFRDTSTGEATLSKQATGQPQLVEDGSGPRA